jgi:hypothetical protein
MTVHLELYSAGERVITETSRVTVRSHLRLPVLVIGTLGSRDFEQIPLARIESFWVEED